MQYLKILLSCFRQMINLIADQIKRLNIDDSAQQVKECLKLRMALLLQSRFDEAFIFLSTWIVLDLNFDFTASCDLRQNSYNLLFNYVYHKIFFFVFYFKSSKLMKLLSFLNFVCGSLNIKM